MARVTEVLVDGKLTQVTEFDHSAQEIDDTVDGHNALNLEFDYLKSEGRFDPVTPDSIGAATTIQKKTGSVITVNNSAHTPLKGLKLFGKTTQEGTPAPDAPVPLVSVGEAGAVNVPIRNSNLLPYPYAAGDTYTENGLTFVVNPDGSVTVNGTAEKEIFFSLANVNNPLYLPKGNIHISGVPSGEYGGSMRPRLWLKNPDSTVKGGVYAEGRTFSITEPGIYILYIDIVAGNTLENFVVKPMVNIGSAALPFESPAQTQLLTIQTPNGLPGIPVTSGGNYTDENGQQRITNYRDYGMGVDVHRVKRMTLSEMNLRYNGVAFYCVTGDKKPGKLNVLCSDYPIKDISVNNGDFFTKGDSIDNSIYIKDSNFTDIASLKAAHGSAVFIYELANPIETDLTAEELAQYAALHTNYPNTTIFNDGGAGMEVEYYTPTTAVQMVHAPRDNGKILGIDEHGCVALKTKEQVKADLGITGSGGGGLLPQIIAPASLGSLVCTLGDITLTPRTEENYLLFDVPTYGEWSLTMGDMSFGTILVDTVKRYTLVLPQTDPNHTMLYDYGDQCSDITGGWSVGATIGEKYVAEFTETGFRVYCPANGEAAAITTNRAVNLTEYTRALFVGDYKGSIYLRASKEKYDSWDKSSSLTDLFMIQTTTTTNTTVVSADISNIYQAGYFSIRPSLGGDGTTNYVTIFKSDDLNLLCQYAEISTPADPETLVSDAASVAAIFHSGTAVLFMTESCTGDFMCAAIQSPVFLAALDASPYKELVYANEHWAKFLAMVV